jgi:hypothetical protein
MKDVHYIQQLTFLRNCEWLRFPGEAAIKHIRNSRPITSWPKYDIRKQYVGLFIFSSIFQLLSQIPASRKLSYNIYYTGGLLESFCSYKLTSAIAYRTFVHLLYKVNKQEPIRWAPPTGTNKKKSILSSESSIVFHSGSSPTATMMSF